MRDDRRERSARPGSRQPPKHFYTLTEGENKIMGFVGVIHPSMITEESLKRHFMYFDEFHIPGLKMFKRRLSENESDEDIYKLQSIEYLEQIEAIQPIDIPTDEIDILINKANILNEEQIRELDSFSYAKVISPFVDIGKIDPKIIKDVDESELLFRTLDTSNYKGKVSPASHPIISNSFNSIESDILSRAYSIRLNLEGVSTTPIIKNINFGNDVAADIETVIAIAVTKFPDLSGKIPFDEVVSFKRENQLLKLELRNWINEISNGESTAKEIEEKLEYLLATYEKELKQHKFDVKFDVFETIVKVPFEIAENLIKLKFSDAIGSIFNIKHRRTRLLKQESKLEGKEIAYIHHAQCKFH